MKASFYIAALCLPLTACGRAPQTFTTGNPCAECDVDDVTQRQTCLDSCLQPPRLQNSDYVITAPRFWRFYDDLADQLPPVEACGSGLESFGDLKPLWRRTLPMGYASGSPYDWQGRSGVSVSHGRVAAALGGILWLFDSGTGEVQHAFETEWRRTDVFDQGAVSTSEQLAAFTPDGEGIWIWGMGPILVDLKHLDPVRGPRAVFAAQFDLPDDGGSLTFDEGFEPSPAVAPDGTFYWQSPARVYSMATGRHLELSVKREPPIGSAAHGEIDLSLATQDALHASVNWVRKLPVGQRLVVGDDGIVYWGSGAAMNPDSTLRWQARPPDGWPYAYGGTTELERPAKRFYWPMLWEETDSMGGATGRRTFAAHSLVDGSPLWSKSIPRVGIAQSISGSYSAQGPDGTLYLVTRPYDSSSPTLAHGYVEARDGGNGDLMWQFEFPSADGQPDAGPSIGPSLIQGGPVPAPNGDGVYVASSNCKLYHLDRNGQVVAWYRLAGQPVWDIPQVADGILYVVAEARRNLDGGDERWCAWRQPEAATRYDCFYTMCGPCVRAGSLTYLYAFKVN